MLTPEVIVLADGQFPEHKLPLGILGSGKSIVCCDGAAMKLSNYGLEPTIIIGDLDSLTPEYKNKYADRLVQDPDQETNDLTKAINYCARNGVVKVYILGATGLREDHTLGNISLLAAYSSFIRAEMYTDAGFFVAVNREERLQSFPGQQISVFSLEPDQLLTLRNLKYPLENKPLHSWWEGSLNEAVGDWFELQFVQGKYLVFRQY
jgi:thiamine pyrophosphokinase